MKALLHSGFIGPIRGEQLIVAESGPTNSIYGGIESDLNKIPTYTLPFQPRSIGGFPEPPNLRRSSQMRIPRGPGAVGVEVYPTLCGLFLSNR